MLTYLTFAQLHETERKRPLSAKIAVLHAPAHTLRRKGSKAVPFGIGQYPEASERSQTALSCRYSQVCPFFADGRPVPEYPESFDGSSKIFCSRHNVVMVSRRASLRQQVFSVISLPEGK
jgi:hypothetical protein